jgi:hypothetical protein
MAQLIPNLGNRRIYVVMPNPLYPHRKTSDTVLIGRWGFASDSVWRLWQREHSVRLSVFRARSQSPTELSDSECTERQIGLDGVPELSARIIHVYYLRICLPLVLLFFCKGYKLISSA